MFKKNHAIILTGILVFASCSTGDKNLETALNSIDAESMKERISVLASDEFLGRAPSTAGEDKTIQYLSDQFKLAGLQPANGESYFQEVSLVNITSDASMELDIKGGKDNLVLAFGDEFIGGTPQVTDNISVDNSEIVFVGYGINSPEEGWNDYERLDVKGKTVLMLVNDPGYATSDSTLFNGKAMTIYGRWTWKYEEAARQGAKAAIIIHETGAAAYPWAVVQNSWAGTNSYLVDNELAASDLLFTGWVTTGSAQKLFESAGIDYNQAIASAAKRGFAPYSMNLQASLSFNNKVEYTKSNNVAALWPGSERADEYIIYTAHWDHFGVNPAFEGDSILNGALDNATGTAALVEIAEAFTSLAKRQDRSILFLAVTCEEQGLLGSKYYAEHPLFPLDKTVAVINMDGLNILGKTKNMTIIGLGNSELDDYAARVIEKQGRYLDPDPTPEQGSYFRSDHFSFAKVGVPALYLSVGFDNVEHGREWGLAEAEKWLTNNYHKPSDNYEPDTWKFDGMIEDLEVYFEVGYDLANTGEYPRWNPGSPFRAVREKTFTLSSLLF